MGKLDIYRAAFDNIEQSKIKKPCPACIGKGYNTITLGGKPVQMTCSKCKGVGYFITYDVEGLYNGTN